MIEGRIVSEPYRKICVHAKKWYGVRDDGRRYYRDFHFQYDDWKHTALGLKNLHLAGFFDLRIEIITMMKVKMYEAE